MKNKNKPAGHPNIHAIVLTIKIVSINGESSILLDTLTISLKYNKKRTMKDIIDTFKKNTFNNDRINDNERINDKPKVRAIEVVDM